MRDKKKTATRKVKTGDKTVDDLYNAVAAYVTSKSGSVVVIGGIAVVDEGKKHSYGVMVRVLGKKPSFDQHPELLTQTT